MIKIVNDYKQETCAARFIGIKYGEEDRVEGSFGAKWREWFQKGLFNKLEVLLTEDFKENHKDSDAYVGLMRYKEGEKFEYWIGMFLPVEAAVPEGYEHVDFQASKLGVCWLKGKEPEIYCKEEDCYKRLEEKGYEMTTDEAGAFWFLERYACPRFTEPDENGDIILDICYFVK